MNARKTKKPMEKGVFHRMAGIMNRAAASLTMRMHVAAANLWRDHYNPLRGLTIQRAASLLEEGERGAYAELMWLYRSIEMQDATLGALIERRTSAIQRLDWNIKTRDDVPEGKQAIAEKQAAALRETYDNLNNLSAALEFLALASFRGYSHLEKVKDSQGRLTELAPVDQWFWVREGIYGTWMLNREGKPGARMGEPVPLERFVIREVARPVNRVALIAFVRKGLSQKDWDAFIETYGIPAVFVIMPPDVPSGKEDEYLSTADAVVSDARGALPHGSDIKTVDNGARGNNPFKDHLAYQDEQIVMRGTGGLLTMLTQSGSGTLAGGAHSDTFEQIAQAEAAEISEIMRRHVDAEILAAVTPGERAYAYFELAANEETDTAAIVKDVVALKGAGYAIAADWIAEKTGYEVERTSNIELPTPNIEVEEIRNRTSNIEVPAWMAALSEDLQPLGKALAEAMQAGDEAAMMAALRKISADMPEFLESDALEDALAEEFTAALLGDEDIRNNCGNGKGGFQHGNKCSKGAGDKAPIREVKIEPADGLFDALGIKKGNIFADCEALANKHPEYFKDSHEAKDFVDFVMKHPTHVLPGNMDDHRLIVHRGKSDRAVALEITLRGGKYRVRSAYQFTPGQFDQKWKKAAGRGAELDFPRVDPDLKNRETPSGCWAGLASQLPAAVERMLQQTQDRN